MGGLVTESLTRETFRHGNLREALISAALTRLVADGVESISLRDLARIAGVNHRAVYRHFPDKLSMLAEVAHVGWARLAQRMKKEMAGKAPGQQTIVAASVGFFLFAREYPNHFHLMTGARLNAEGKFPELEAAVVNTMKIFSQAFAEASSEVVRERTATFIAALQGVVTQILHARLRIAPAKAKSFVAGVCIMLIKGLG